MEQPPISEAPGRPQEVRQHNVITTARYDYSACQMDIMFFLLSCLGKADAPDKVYTIYLKEMEAKTGRQWNYQQLQEATSDMGSRMFVVDGEKKRTQLWMMDRVEYMMGGGHIAIVLTQSIRPYLFDLKENFTSYELESALKLTSKYAKRIYQLVSQWKDKDETKIYSLDEFKYMMYLKGPESKKKSSESKKKDLNNEIQAPEEELQESESHKNDPEVKTKELFKNISQLKLRVLDVAVDQISEHTELKIKYEFIKKGRAFNNIRFSITRQKTAQPPLFLEQPPVTGDKVEAARQHLLNLGIIQPQLVAQILGDQKLKDQLFKFVYDHKTDKLKVTKNAGGLFLKMCGLR
ncbi:replication initiation protein [Hymenobacter antarcticus]|uniref:Initiator Rep protein WH1 domain-containing protein n=1 Tax=Hymenobacter antarcticus TaxID=486270 RepID=A0ABP7QMF7_9BACT